MRIQIDQFQGMTPRPDPAEVGSRFSRNITFGPGGTWIETRPGTEQLTTTIQPSAQPEDDFPNDPEFASAYRLKDDRIESLVLVQATRDDTAEVGRRSNAPRVVCPVTFMPLSVVGFGSDAPNPDPPDPPESEMAIDDFQGYSAGAGVTLDGGEGWTEDGDIDGWGT